MNNTLSHAGAIVTVRAVAMAPAAPYWQ